MYAQPSYSYGPGPSISAPFNPNGVQPPPHTPHQQQQNLQQPGQQHMMYNPSQHYGGAGMASGAAPAQSPYGTPISSSSMGGNAGAMGMMQNNGMAHTGMAGPGHVPTYQTPYSSSPYGGNLPSTAANLPPNFSNPTSFNMNAQNMNLQHPGQRMQPLPTSSTPTQPSQRVSPFASGQQHTPPNAGAQSQFVTPQIQNPTQNQQGQPILTPQTPTFPQGGGNLATPLSPGSESREKERVTLLLEINRELLLEVLRLQNVLQEEKKGEAAGVDKDEAEKAKDTAKPGSRDYVECMRRLQSNLAYLAAIADRSHKPSSQIPAHPAIMFAPPLSPNPTSTSTTASPKTESKMDSSTPTEDKKPDSSETEDNKNHESSTDRSEVLKDHYKKLQGLFPGVDPKKEPTARPQGQMGGAGPGQKTAADINAQQKLQNDLLRQKMMQAQQAQAHAMAQQQAQNQTR